ncbi:MAG: hypothetical protein HY707_05395 [Ignavibacteriae bacterium]|nr:hypothetical protein [Ignavibacteriota bacterium]
MLFSQGAAATSERAVPGSGQRSLQQQNIASILFDKSLNTYRWIGRAIYSNTVGPFSLQFNEQFLSTLVRADRKLITDEQSLDFSVKRRIINSLQATGRASSFILSDNRSIGISNASSHAFYGGIQYFGFHHLTLEPLVGMRFDNQIDQRDRGLSLLMNVLSDSLEFDGYQTELNARFQYDKLDPRKLETHRVLARIDKVFFGQTRNSLKVQYNRNRRDFYVPADPTIQQQYNVTHNIETRSEHALTLSDSLDYNLGKQTLLTFQGNLFTREITRETRYKHITVRRPALDTEVNELRIEGSAEARYKLGHNLRTSLKVAYQERDEKHAVQPEETALQFDLDSLSRVEERKNNHSRRTMLASKLDVEFSRAHVASLTASGNLLRYDTPSLANNDDRDELWYILNLATFHQLNQHLNVTFMVDANLVHLVYLSSSRSADNIWNRIFRLKPRLEYIPSTNLTTINTFEVLANYTVYDFEFVTSQVRSFAFRQFAFVDSTTIHFTKRTAVEWFSHIRLYERGELRWHSFSERPVNYFEDKTIIGTLQHQVNPGLLFSIGIRYFSQSRFSYVGRERILEYFLRSIGPITGILWNPGGRMDFSLKGWYEQQSLTGLPKRSYANMTMSLSVSM